MAEFRCPRCNKQHVIPGFNRLELIDAFQRGVAQIVTKQGVATRCIAETAKDMGYASNAR